MESWLQSTQKASAWEKEETSLNYMYGCQETGFFFWKGTFISSYRTHTAYSPSMQKGSPVSSP